MCIELALTTIALRESDLLQCERLLGWCRLGDARRSNMSAVSERYCWRDRQPFLYHYVSMDMATTRSTEAN